MLQEKQSLRSQVWTARRTLLLHLASLVLMVQRRQQPVPVVLDKRPTRQPRKLPVACRLLLWLLLRLSSLRCTRTLASSPTYLMERHHSHQTAARLGLQLQTLRLPLLPLMRLQRHRPRQLKLAQHLLLQRRSTRSRWRVSSLFRWIAPVRLSL